MSENLPAAIKPTGDEQRVDVSLTKEIAHTLGVMVLAGQTINPRRGKLVLDMGEGKTVELARNQVTRWQERGNVIPETGQSFHEFIQEKYEEKRVAADRAEQQDIIEMAQRGLAEVLKIPTKNGKMTIRKYKISNRGGKVTEREYGRVITEIEGHNAKMVEAKAKALTFALERLRPGEYALKTKNEHQHLHFSLADLRKVRDARDERFAIPV